MNMDKWTQQLHDKLGTNGLNNCMISWQSAK